MKLPYSPHSLDRRQNGSIHSRPFNGGLLVNLFKINDKLFVEYRKNSRSELQVESDNGLKLKEFQKRQSLAQSGANVKELRLIPWTEFNPVRDKRERESDKYNSKEQKEMQRNQKNCTGNDQHTSQEKDKEEPRGETCRSQFVCHLPDRVRESLELAPIVIPVRRTLQLSEQQSPTEPAELPRTIFYRAGKDYLTIDEPLNVSPTRLSPRRVKLKNKDKDKNNTKGISYTVPRRQCSLSESKTKKSANLQLQHFLKREQLQTSILAVGEIGDYESQSITILRGNMAIYSYCGSQQREVASLTKIMTCLCCLYLAEKHHISLSTTRTSISKHCSSMEGTSAGLKQADSITLNDLLYAMMLPSGNDAAEALAQYFGEVAWRDTQERKRKNKAEVHKAESTKLDNKMGEKEAFKSKELSQKIVKQWEYTATTDSDRHCNVYLSAQCSVSTFIGCMNHLSQHLHLLNTQFANCHGLADCRNRSTSNDLSELSYHAMKNVRFKEIVTTRTYECSVFNKYAGMARLMRWNNTNKLLDLEYCEGIKTGHTSVAGACMAAYFSGDEELEVIIVTLKAKSKSTRFEEVRRLYQWAKRKGR